MPRIRRAGKAQAAREAMSLLAALAAEGAYAMAANGPDGVQTFSVGAPEGKLAQPAVEVSRTAVALALRKGWVTPDASGTSLRLSAAGKLALKEPARPQAAARAGARTRRRIEGAGAESALAWLRNRRDKSGRPLITDVQFTAGERLAADFWHAQLSPRVTANWSAMAPAARTRRATPGFGVDMRDAVLAARRRFQRALDAVGVELAGILVDVCCHDVGLEAAGRAAGWPQRAAKVVLDLALTRLARHYGLILPERAHGGRVRQWGEADYRPTLERWL